MAPRTSTSLIALALLCDPPFLAAQEAQKEAGVAGATPARAAEAAVDPRFRSPRATVRAFPIAINPAEDEPDRIEDAIECLDLASLPPDRREGGRLAFELEQVLRAVNLPTFAMSDAPDGARYEIGEGEEIKIGLDRKPDGRWLTDAKTLEALPTMRLAVWRRNASAASERKDAPEVPADLRSPYATFHTFMDAFTKGEPDAAARCLDLSEIPAPARGRLGPELAYKLKQVLDRTRFVIFQDVPDNEFGLPLEALVHREGRITGERQATGPRKGLWLFNRATVRSIDRLYDAFEGKPLVPELTAIGRTAAAPEFWRRRGLWLRSVLPGWLRHRVAIGRGPSLALYQIAGLGVLVLLIAPIYRLAAWPAARPLRFLMRRRGVPADDREIRSWSRPIGWLAAIWMLVEGGMMLDLRMGAAGPFLAVLVPALRLAAALAAYQLLDPILRLLAGPAAAQPGATTLAAMGYPVLALVLKIVVVAWGLAAFLDLFDFDVGTVLAGLGIGGLAFALAAQDTLKNFIGSLMLIADRTFRVGDLVEIGGNKGVVESVGLRTTRIRGLDDSLLTIPNSDLTTAHVTNFGARRHRQFRTRVTAPYGTSPERLIAFRDGILERLRKHHAVRPERLEVALEDLGEDGVEVLIQAILDVPYRRAETNARDALILDLIRLADRHGIAPFARPGPSDEAEATGSPIEITR